MIRAPYRRQKRDSTIPLINIVFLMLIFFLLTGTLAPPLDPDLELVDTAELDGREPPDALVLRKDGTLSYRGAAMTPEAYMASQGTDAVRIVPDRDVSASRLIEVTASLRRLGAPAVFLVTRQALE